MIDSIGNAPLVAAASLPWPGEVTVLAGLDPSNLTERISLLVPALMGKVVEGASAQPIGRWDRASALLVSSPLGALGSVSSSAALAGANQILIETSSGWELIAFAEAELVGEGLYRLRQLLRGLRGTAPRDIASGARCVVLDDAVGFASVSAEEIGVPLIWRTDSAASSVIPWSWFLKAAAACLSAPGICGQRSKIKAQTSHGRGEAQRLQRVGRCPKRQMTALFAWRYGEMVP